MKKIFVILCAGLLISAGLQAQKMYIENGKVILDMTVAAGMPEGSTTNVSKTALYADAVPSETDTIENNTQGAAINATVFQKLEIAPDNLGTMNWMDAMAGCKNKGTGWRLPTQRELMMMWIFREALDEALPIVGGTVLLPSTSKELYYRSATEHFDPIAYPDDGMINSVWSMYFISTSVYGITQGLSSPRSKSTTNTTEAARCVREVTN
jgi:hypothetical protein